MAYLRGCAGTCTSYPLSAYAHIGSSAHVRAQPPKRLSAVRGCAEQHCVRPASWSRMTRTAPGGPVTTVLIADDDADHRELLTLALRRSGHDVVTADDAPSAMALLLAGGIDVALLDVRMPGESGIELCRRLRAE